MPSSKQFSYEVDVSWAGGRSSKLTTEGRTEILSGPPADFPLGDASRWSPEHLFLASLASCTMISFLAHADHRGVEVRDYESRIDGVVMRRGRALRLRPRAPATEGDRGPGPGRPRPRADRQGGARLLHLGVDDGRDPK
jgi:organic hydroperoxide reductase OsmC/OhrA